jgi:hypothetical protein
MNQKHILPCPKFLVFSASSLPQSFSLLPTSLPPTSPSYLTHLILRSLHHQSSRVLEAGTIIVKAQEFLKRNPELIGQNRTLKVSSFPSLWFCCSEEDDIVTFSFFFVTMKKVTITTVVTFFFLVLLQRKRRWQQAIVTFFFGYVATKKATTTSCCRLLLFGFVAVKKVTIANNRHLLFWDML